MFGLLKKKPYKELEKKFDYKFKDIALLKKALSHRSYANEKKLPATEHNERLEFLGDAVLELAVSEILMERFPQFTEGDLSKLRAAIVNEKQLAELAKKYEVGRFIKLGLGEERSHGRRKPSLLSDAYEAILGAIYQDSNFRRAKRSIRKHYEELLKDRDPEEFYRDYKTELQEKAQYFFKTVPTYKLSAQHGPDHAKIFEVELTIKGEVFGSGRGRSKKAAEQMAAHESLKKIASMKLKKTPKEKKK